MKANTPIIILSATSFLPLCGQSVNETPDDCSSERRSTALDIGTCSVTCKYALNNFTLPKVCATERMLFTIAYPKVFEGAGQFSGVKKNCYKWVAEENLGVHTHRNPKRQRPHQCFSYLLRLLDPLDRYLECPFLVV